MCFSFGKLLVFSLSFYPPFLPPALFSCQPDQFLEMTQLVICQEHREGNKCIDMQGGMGTEPNSHISSLQLKQTWFWTGKWSYRKDQCCLLDIVHLNIFFQWDFSKSSLDSGSGILEVPIPSKAEMMRLCRAGHVLVEPDPATFNTRPEETFPFGCHLARLSASLFNQSRWVWQHLKAFLPPGLCGSVPKSQTC